MDEQEKQLLREVSTKMDTVLAELEEMKLALGEAGILIVNQQLAVDEQKAGLLDHKKQIEALGAATTRLWHELNLPVQERPQMPEGPVN